MNTKILREKAVGATLGVSGNSEKDTRERERESFMKVSFLQQLHSSD